MKNVLVTSTEYAKNNRNHINEMLKNYNYNVIYDNNPNAMTEDQLIQSINTYQCEGLMVYLSKDEVTRKVIEACPGLKVISRHGVGMDNIDVTAAKEKNIIVCNTGNSHDYEAVADLCFTMILECGRKLYEFDRQMKQGIWNRTTTHDVYGKTLGILGFGRIGKAVARRAEAFNMKILVANTSQSPAKEVPSYVTVVNKETLLRESDFVSLHCTVAPETIGIIGEKELEIMKNTAYLINTGRAALVDNKALLHALVNHTIGGAAIDVYEKEPTTEDPFMTSDLDNVILSPHVGVFTQETLLEIDKLAMENMLRHLKSL